MHPSGDGTILYLKYIYIYTHITLIKKLLMFNVLSDYHFTILILSADSAVPTSEFRTSAVLLLDYKGKLLPFQAVKTQKGSRI
jgi:hypothetical protein